MDLKARIQEDMKTALRDQDAERLSVLRLIRAAIRDAEIEQQRELDDAGVIQVLTKAVRQRQESIQAYRQGGREDLAGAEERELRIIQSYLPRQLDEAELRVLVRKTIDELGARGPEDLGRVMKHLMAQVRGQADGRVVQTLVREALGG
ncbi:MAG: GatB/YqeY domain-containing protein [Chloroflexia bacterium]